MKITTQLNPSLPVLSKNPTASNFLPKGLPTDIQGADLEALTRFNQSLPKVVPKVLKKPGEEDALDELSEVVSDSPEWQMAQAEAVGAGAGAEAAAATAAEAAGAGAAGSGAAGAGAAGAGAAGAAGAGAAGAVGVLSPLAFTPSLLLVDGGSNSAPVATFTTAQNAVEDGSVISGQLTSTDPDGIDLGTTYSLVGDPIPGLTITPNGAWRFDATGNAYQSLAQGETREITVSYVVTDTPGATDTASFVITVTGTNDVPVVQVTDVVGGATELVTPAGNLSDSGTISFTDVDLIDLHTVSEVTPSEDALGTLTATVSTGTDDSTGLGGVITWDYSVAASAVEYIASGETKEETFTFSLLDGQGGSVERTITITITGTNDAPILTVDAEGGVTEDADSTTLSDSGTLSFTDVDVTDTHAVTASYNEDAVWTNTSDATLSDEQITALTNGFVIKGDKSGWDYSVANSATQFLAEGETVTFSYDVTVQDDSGVIANNSDTKKVTVTITGTNDISVLSVEDPVYYLPLNADAGVIETFAKFSIADKDYNDTHTYFFWNGSKEAASNETADGYFAIDGKTGEISLTEKGEDEIGAGKPALPCASDISLDVVVFDGTDYSAPETLTIKRVLPEFISGGYDSLYSVGMILDPVGDAHVPHITLQDTYDGMALIDFDRIQFSGKLKTLEMFRKNDVENENDALYMKVKGAANDKVHISVDNHFDGDAMEFVHFQKETSLARYDLGGSNAADETWASEEATYPYFQDHGVYLISTEKAAADGETVSGTVCNDVVVGSYGFKELLYGDQGNDLLFSKGDGDTVRGGAGDDLIVLDDEDDTLVMFETASTNGFDTIVGFDDDHTRIQLQAADTVFPLVGDDVDVLTKGALLKVDGEDDSQLNLSFSKDDAEATAVVAMSTESEWNLHTWLNTPGSDEKIYIEGYEDADPPISLYFLVEESAAGENPDTYTHLFHAVDSDNSGSLSANEFTHMAQFAGVGINEFSSHSFAVIPV